MAELGAPASNETKTALHSQDRMVYSNLDCSVPCRSVMRAEIGEILTGVCAVLLSPFLLPPVRPPGRLPVFFSTSGRF